MANRMGPNDWRSASPVTDDGHATWVQRVEVVTGTGAIGPAAAAKTSVASGTASVTILAANANRRGATISNTDANILYLDLSGGTASATSFTVAVAANGYYEVPFGYTGLITGVWAVDGTGAALVTEFS